MENDAQRRVRRSPLLFTAPLVLLGALTLILAWETVRSNVTGDLAEQWPWRLRLMDMSPLGSLVAVAAAAVLARAQYARTVRPVLGWRASWSLGPLTPHSAAWTVGILNGGQQHAVIEQVDYQVVLTGGEARPWYGHAGTQGELRAVGLEFGTDYLLELYAPGFPLAGGSGTVQTGLFTRRFVERVDALRMRVRVVDSVGDSHERVMDLMRGAR
ncbi:hypothetical protein ACIQNU_36150 [Streptomyces sp. NPDC091292]|uniref:hypothetical protein n=1 Tax=Streptomyces sp. NPDC091292 TaxID=3365991 RepID=UPI0037FD9790